MEYGETNGFKEDVKRVVEYLWGTENAHFCENEHPDEHIFNVLRRINVALDIGLRADCCYDDAGCPFARSEER